MPAHMRVHSTEGVVQQIDIVVCVHGPRQADSLLLTTAHADTLPKIITPSEYCEKLFVEKIISFLKIITFYLS